MVKRVSSSEFRVTYVRLLEPVAVTVLDRVIGYYLPGGVLDTIRVGDEDMVVLRGAPTPRSGQLDTSAGGSEVGTGRTEAPEPPLSSPSPAGLVVDVSASPKGPGAPADGSTAGMSQSERDKVLAKVRTGKKG